MSLLKQTEVATRWVTSAQDALSTVDVLYKAKKYNHALFFLHLSLEKLLKAIIIMNTNDAPPSIHDLVRLATSATIVVDEKMLSVLAEISTFNIAARYDEEKLQFYKKATNVYAEQWIKIGSDLFLKFCTLI